MADSVYARFQKTVATRGSAVAARTKSDGAWHDTTWNALAAQVEAAAAGLIALGVSPSDRVAIFSSTRLEWTIADLAIISAGAVTVPIYQSSTAAEARFILEDAECSLAFAEGQAQLRKLRSTRAHLPALQGLIGLESSAVDSESGWETRWSALLELGAARLKRHPEEVEKRAAALRPDDLMTLIYTSGTTGEPKGAMLSHDSLMYVADAALELGFVSGDDVHYLFLPLAHVFARALEVGWVQGGFVTAFWEGDQRKIIDNLAEVRPTVMAGVPRIFEKVHARVVSDLERTPGLRGAIARWGLRKGREAAALGAAGKRPKGLGWALARRLVFGQIGARLKAGFGGRMRFFGSGGAPLSSEIALFFDQAGVSIYEGYGLTETTAAVSLNVPGENRIGTVGRPWPGTEVKLAGDGEILVRGRGVMTGYWKREEATADAIDPEGWFRTGDIGTLDGAGYLTITDRKKDIIVTAGGKNVAPQKLENGLKSRSPLISQVVVHGDQRKYLTALITVDADALKSWARGREIGDRFDYGALVRSAAINAVVSKAVDGLNRSLPSHETLKKFEILDHDFEVGDQLTPTLKVKRKLCNQRYRETFDAMYPT